MQQNLELLQGIPFFSSFPGKAIKLLAFLADRAHLAKGDILFEEGDDHGRAYLLLKGQLHLLKANDDKNVLVQSYTKGDFLGSTSLLGSMPALFTLQAATETVVLQISREHFSKILEQFPETAKISVKALLQELHEWERKNIHMAEACCLSRTGATVI